MRMEEFKVLFRNVDRYYKGFEDAVVSYIKMPGNADKKELIENYILDHPEANSSDVLEYMVNETGFRKTYANYIFDCNTSGLASV
jgi:hypothetical protein